mgnify:FL=1
MLQISMYITIQTLWEQGYNKAEIAKITGHDWKTVNKIINAYQKGKSGPCKKQHPCILDQHQALVLELLEKGLSGVRIHEELKNKGISIGYTSVKSYIVKIKGRENICIRFDAIAGKEAQVDFGYIGKQPYTDGKMRKAWVFNMRLSYSRLDYYEVVFDQKVETFIKCHINAFRYFAGVVCFVKIDNLKAAILEANFYEPTYQELYKKFAQHYGFAPLPCRVRQPQEKGKVEAGIKYIKNNFFKGRTFLSYDELQSSLKEWLNNKCNLRIHGTTRKVPMELFKAEEAKVLIKLPVDEFVIPLVMRREVYRDCHVYINYNYYSAPYQYVGKTVEIELKNSLVYILYNGQQIAVHPQINGQGKFQTNKEHYPPYKHMTDTNLQKLYQSKMINIGPHAEQFFIKVLEQKEDYWPRIIQGILSLTKEYTPQFIDLACQRAVFYGALQYKYVKNICASGCYNLPIDYNQEACVWH